MRFLPLPLLLCLTTFAVAQDAARVVSPEIHEDKTITFRLRAPEAARVAVSGDWGAEGGAMMKDDAGVWSLTLGPLAPDLYSYSFRVDGVSMADPSNAAVKLGRSPTNSVLELPASPPAVWDRQPGAARGEVHLEDYFAKSLGRERRLRVYTPPGYDAQKEARYPVLYLLHGSGDNETTWTEFGHAQVLLDNLIAAGKAVPMLVVTPNGHTTLPGEPLDRVKAMADFQRELVEDIIPLVEAHYRARPEPAARALSGLSMGGNQTLTIGLNHPEVFAWIGAMSSALPQPEETLAPFLAHDAALKEKVRLLWIGCGKDDRLFPQNVALHELLTARHIPHDWRETEGAHKWTTWRRHLAELAPKLFQEGR